MIEKSRQQVNLMMLPLVSKTYDRLFVTSG